MPFTLESKTALVTGAGRGIGRAIAQKLAEYGAAVMVNDLDSALAAETAERCERGVHQLLREVRRGDVAGQVRSAATCCTKLSNVGRGFRSRSGVEIVDHDGGARGGKLRGDGAADAAAGAGDKGNFGI